MMRIPALLPDLERIVHWIVPSVDRLMMAVALGGCLMPAVPGQQMPSRPATTPYVIRTEATEIDIAVSALDRRHTSVRDLTERQISVAVDGHPAVPERFVWMSPDTKQVTGPERTLPPDVEINLPRARASAAENLIILADAINTRVNDRPTMAKQLAAWLSRARS